MRIWKVLKLNYANIELNREIPLHITGIRILYCVILLLKRGVISRLTPAVTDTSFGADLVSNKDISHAILFSLLCHILCELSVHYAVKAHLVKYLQLSLG